MHLVRDEIETHCPGSIRELELIDDPQEYSWLSFMLAGHEVVLEYLPIERLIRVLDYNANVLFARPVGLMAGGVFTQWMNDYEASRTYLYPVIDQPTP